MIKNENISIEDDSAKQPIELNVASCKLLLTIEEDLKELEESDLRVKEDESSEDSCETDSEEDFLTKHFEEFEKLKEIFAAPDIRLADISWFFRTALFRLMNAEPESFFIKPLEIYEYMLEKIHIASVKIFHQHLKILLDKKTEDKSMFAFGCFFPVLSKAREKGSFKANRKRRLSEYNSQNKRIKLAPSPLAMENNQLSNSTTSDVLETGVRLTI